MKKELMWTDMRCVKSILLFQQSPYIQYVRVSSSSFFANEWKTMFFTHGTWDKRPKERAAKVHASSNGRMIGHNRGVQWKERWYICIFLVPYPIFYTIADRTRLHRTSTRPRDGRRSRIQSPCIHIEFRSAGHGSFVYALCPAQSTACAHAWSFSSVIKILLLFFFPPLFCLHWCCSHVLRCTRSRNYYHREKIQFRLSQISEIRPFAKRKSSNRREKWREKKIPIILIYTLVLRFIHTPVYLVASIRVNIYSVWRKSFLSDKFFHLWVFPFLFSFQDDGRLYYDYAYYENTHTHTSMHNAYTLRILLFLSINSSWYLWDLISSISRHKITTFSAVAAVLDSLL